MKLIRISQLVVGSLIAAALGCGGSERPVRSTTETTASTVSVTPMQLNEAQENAARLERERDEARQLADTEKARRDREVQALRERSEFEVKIRKQLDATDEELRVMKEKSIRGSAASRARVDELMQKRDSIEQALRRSHDESADSWDRFKTDIETSVEDLKKSVSTPAQPPAGTKKAPQGATTPPSMAPSPMSTPPAAPTSPASKQP